MGTVLNHDFRLLDALDECHNRVELRDLQSGNNLDSGVRKFMTQQSRWWGSILYPDSEVYDCDKVISDLLELCNNRGLRYYYALHDSDVLLDDTGSPLLMEDGMPKIKKPHYHFLVCVPDGTISAFTIRKECPSLWRDPGNSWYLVQGKTGSVDERLAVRYLVHADSKGKTKYDWSIVHSNTPEVVERCMQSEPKKHDFDVEISAIMRFIHELPYLPTFNIVMDWSIERGYGATFFRAQYGIDKYLKSLRRSYVKLDYDIDYNESTYDEIFD